MIRAVLWKEWREQAAIIVALLALGGGVIAAAVQFGGTITDSHPLEFRGYGEAGRLAFLMLALTAGTVIGGALFAGEAEAGTSGYLETLPASRWRLWRGKMVAGVVLTAAAGATLIAEAVALGALGPTRTAVGWAGWSAGLILAAFGWGAFGSVLSRSTLTACGIGVIAAPFFGMAFLLVATIGVAFIDSIYDIGPPRLEAAFAFIATTFFLFFAPIWLSGLIYSARDRARRDHELTPGTIGTTRAAAREVGRRKTGFGFRALLWLLFRQYRLPALILVALAAMFGWVMLIEGAPMIAGWPAATLVMGVLVGVIGWADEQGRGASRFWGERRLPVGRLWAAKVIAGLGLTLGLAVVYLLPSMIREAASESEAPFLLAAFRSGLLVGDTGLFSRVGVQDHSNLLYFVFLWPIYGFAFGHLAGMLFKKAIVAAGVGILAGGMFAALWLPSFFAGGLHHWQLWPVPLIVVLTARLIARAWSADRIGTRRPLTALVSGIVLAFGLTAAGLGYRVIEVPNTPLADADLQFAKTVPGYEQNEAGREVRTALSQFRQVGYHELNRGGLLLFPTAHENAARGMMPNPAELKLFREQVHLIVKNGWPANRPDADAWLDAIFANRWDEPLYVAAEKDLGVFEDPTTSSILSMYTNAYGIQEVPSLMVVRGLQLQTRGDPAAYVRHLDATLALARNVRNKSYAHYPSIARGAENQALVSLDRWLERLDGRPDLLRELLRSLTRHEATMPTDPGEAWLAGRTVVRNSVTAPSEWAEKYLTSAIGNLARKMNPEAVKTQAELEANLLGFAWAVPWEQERLRRVVGLGNDPKRTQEVDDLIRGAPGVFEVVTPDIAWAEPYAAAQRRAAILRVALRLYEAEEGKLPDSLDRLVPKYLPAVPTDPFDNKPFRYRLSAGEKVAMELLPQPQSLPLGFGAPENGMILVPGLDAESWVALPKEEVLTLAAVAGGWLAQNVPPPNPPGLEPPRIWDEGFDAVAAAAGGVVQWPLPPLTTESVLLDGAFPDEMRTPGGLPAVPQAFGGLDDGPFVSPRRVNPFGLADERRIADVASGQGVLWSIGGDEIDDGGKDLAGPTRGRNAVSFGDLVYVVPLPAGKQPKKEKSP